MPTKKLDDFEWDESLDYDFDDPYSGSSKQKSKHGVIQKVAVNFTQGATDALKTPSTLRNIAKAMLPKGYGKAFDLHDQVSRQAQELYHIAQDEIRPSIPVLKNLTQRNLPKARKYLPKGVADKLEAFSQPSSGNGPKGNPEEEDIRRQMAEVFGVQMEADARQNAENKFERALQHAQSTGLSKQQVRSLNVMQQGIMRLVNYQDDVTNRYQRRSLELQTRHYLVARDSLRLQAETAKRQQAQFDALVNNTAMPDIAKQTLRHSAKQVFRNKLMNNLQNTAGKWAGNYISGIGKRAGEQLKDVMGGASSALDMIGADGSPIPFQEMLFQMLGQTAAEKGGQFLGKKAAPWLTKLFPKLAEKGGVLEYGIGSLPQLLNRYAKSATTRGGLLGSLEDMFKSTLGQYKMNTVVGQNGISQLDKPATFDALTRRSIIEIIPGFLSRIEHNTAMVFDPKAQRQVYNHDRREFSTVKTAGNDALNASFTKDSRARIKQSINDFVDDVIGKRPISDSTRKAFIRQLLLDSGNAEPFDPRRYSDPASNTPELDGKAKLELGQIFQTQGRTAEGKLDFDWMSKRAETLQGIDFGGAAPIGGASAYRSAGQRELFKSQGLIYTKDGKDHLDISKILDLVENADVGDIKQKKTSAGERTRAELNAKVAGIVQSAKDLYVQGGTKAVLSAGRLKAGGYVDAVTGAVIKKWTDIRGPVKDLVSGDIVIDVDQLSMGLVDGKGKSITFNLRSATKKASDFAQDLGNQARTRGQKVADDVREVLNGRGEVLLSAVKLKLGKYRDALTQRPIYKPEDIAGPVIDEDGRTVITASDIPTLKDSKGNKLTEAVSKMRANAASVASGGSTPPPLPPQNGPTASAVGGDGVSNMFNPDQPAANDSELVRLNSEQVELLKAIAQILAAQGPGGGGHYPKGFLDSIAIGGIKAGWSITKAVGRGTKWWTGKVFGGIGSAVSGVGHGIGAVGQGAAYRIGNLVRGIKDIYIQGKRKPAMTAEKLKLGHYQDVNTKKKIQRWSDVTGPVVDLKTGETVVDQADFDAGLYSKGATGLVRLAKKSIMGLGSAVVSFYGGLATLPFKMASAALKGVVSTMKWATNKQVDVYVKGERSPRLYATKMKQGRYYNAGPKKTGKEVKTYEDIYGEIRELQRGSDKALPDDKIVLSEEEITDPGLSNRWGMSLRTPLSRLIGAVGGAAVGLVKGAGALFKGALKGYGKLFGGMLGLGGGLIGAPFKFLGALLNPFEKHGAKQVELLQSIFKVLDERLAPKKARKGSWQEAAEAREEKKKEEATGEATAARERKWGIGGVLGWLGKKAGGLFGLGKKHEEEENDEDDEDDGSVLDDVGDAAMTADSIGSWRERRRRKKAAKQRLKARKGKLPRGRGRLGRLARLFRRGKGAVEGVEEAAGAAAKASKVAKGASFLSKLGRFKPRGASIGGVVGGLATGAALSYGGSKASEWLGEDSTTGKVLNVAGNVGAASMVSGALGGPTLGALAAPVLSGIGTAAAGIIGAPLFVPLAIVGAAVAAAGALAYYGFKQYKYGKLTPIRRFRYLQYGVAPGDAGNNKKIFGLEEALLDHVIEKNGGLDFSEKSISGGKALKMADVFKLMGLDDGWFSNKSDERSAFIVWFNRRFKPVFLKWVGALKGLEPTMALLDADEKLKQDKQAQLVKAAWGVDRNIYAITASPFPGTPSVTDVGQIEDAYNLALKETTKTDSERKADKWWNRARAVASVIPGAGLAMSFLTNKADEKDAKLKATEETMQKAEQNAGASFLSTSGKIKNTKNVDALLASPLSKLGKISALTALRFRAYGLSDLDQDRVRCLAALEALVFKKIQIADNGTPHLPVSDELVYLAVCGLFGLLPNSPQDRARFMGWYGHRFLPVCLAYVKAVRSIDKTADLQMPEKSLKADKLLLIAQSVLNTKDDDGKSTWFWTRSPWSVSERLNSDSETISGSLAVLKASADKKVIDEDKTPGSDANKRKDKGLVSSMMDKMKDQARKARDFLLGTERDRTWLGKAVDGIGGAASNIGRRIAGGVQATVDNSREAYDRFKHGDVRGGFGASGQALTAGGRYWTGIGVPKEPKLVGNAKDRERVLIQEAIKAGITDPTELAMLLGQVAEESGSFAHLIENLNYRPEVARRIWPNRFPSLDFAKQILAQGPVAFADFIYNGRMGNTANGDGYKYRGRGLMQLTGKANYMAFARDTGIDVVDNPDLVATDPRVAALSAIHYWKTRVKGKASPSDLAGVTRLINGGLTNLEQRRSYVNGYLKKFEGKSVDEILASYGGGSVPAAPGSPTAKTVAPPVTTTTTANGTQGGVQPAAKAAGAAPMPATNGSPAPVVPSQSDTSLAYMAPDGSGVATNSLATGGGSAAMMANGGLSPSTTGPTTATATPAPSIDSVRTLDVAARTSTADDTTRAQIAALEKARKDAETRLTEVQSQWQSKNDQSKMALVGDILKKSLETQQSIAKNTADTYTAVRDLIKQLASSQAPAPAGSDNVTTTRSPSSRPVQQRRDQLPVSVAFSRNND